MIFSLLILCALLFVCLFFVYSSYRLIKGQFMLCSVPHKDVQKSWHAVILQFILSILIILTGFFFRDHWLEMLRNLFWPLVICGPGLFVISFAVFIYDLLRKDPKKAIIEPTIEEPAVTTTTGT